MLAIDALSFSYPITLHMDEPQPKVLWVIGVKGVAQQESDSKSVMQTSALCGAVVQSEMSLCVAWIKADQCSTLQKPELNYDRDRLPQRLENLSELCELTAILARQNQMLPYLRIRLSLWRMKDPNCLKNCGSSVCLLPEL